MGSLCSKGSTPDGYFSESEGGKDSNKSTVQLIAPSREEIAAESSRGKSDGSVHPIPNKAEIQENKGSVHGTKYVEDDGKDRIIERPKRGSHHRRATFDMGLNRQSTMSLHGGAHSRMSRISSTPCGVEGEEIAAGWPSWLTSVAAEAVQGWTPRSTESFEKLNKIGQGTYSSVYRARDLKTNKIVAMKKVRFVNMDPESVRFMAREICILRRLDHPNVMKLEAIVTSRMSGSLYLVFEYMEHDLSGLAASPNIKFSEPQIKCYMQQLLSGLEHCHGRGVLHRDIKGSNLLIDNNGVLKIGDFGLASRFEPDNSQPLTSRVVTLWYRAPELLLGATQYGPAIDMWSAGCILAELFAGKPIMPGRTEVEQMHKIFKLCGSPSEEYWRKTKLPHATSFKPQHRYKRRIVDTFQDFPPSAVGLVDVLLTMNPEERGTATSALKSEFFTTEPLACDPSSLPKYPPSKEYDARLRDEEERRRKAEAVKRRGAESVRAGRRESKGNVHSPEFIAQGQQQVQSNKCASVKYKQGDSISGFTIDPRGRTMKNGVTHASSMIHPIAAGSWTNSKVEEAGSGRLYGSSRHGTDFKRQRSHMSQSAVDSSINQASSKETMGYVPKKNRIHCSGPLMPPGGNMEDMLKEHERQIQEAVRKARLDKARTKKNCYDDMN